MLRSDLAELPNILTTQGAAGYHLVSIVNTIDTQDLTREKYYSVWELPL
jgi:hypothetical protein